MSKNNKSSLTIMLAGVLLMFIAAVMALVSFKVGYWPWELTWLSSEGIASPVWLILVENLNQVGGLATSALLIGLHLIIVRRSDAFVGTAEENTPVDECSDESGDLEEGGEIDESTADEQDATPEADIQVTFAATAAKIRDSQLQIALAEVNRLKKELVNSRRETESAVKARAQFLANMSHELRTPMNGIMGMSELLNECDLPEKEKHFASSIGSSAESLLTIISDLLDFSRMEAGEMRLEHARFDVGACAEEVCAILATSTQNKGVELICYVDAELPKYVNGDAARFRQVLNNLISNSISFTNAGEIVVRLSRVESTDSIHTFKCDVQDTGSGIAPELQATLFQSFQQADGSSTRRHGGLGIGLAITSELVTLMGGKMNFRSRLGEGTRFTFTCDFQRVADEGANQNYTEDFTGASVLIVDDNETNRSILFHQLTAWGLEVQVAESGDEALGILNKAAANDSLFDMLILDLHMPDMDGIELTREIRNTPAIASSKIMMLTSAIVELSADEMRKLGIGNYISKPARQSQLRECLRDLVSSGQVKSNLSASIQDQIKQTISDVPTTVLLAEDDKSNLDVARAMLEALNCSVTLATDGKEAVELASSTAFDIIFMDCQMPILDGFAATERIKNGDGPNVDTPIVALTANSMPGDRARCLDAGMQDYISKPLRQQQMASAIGKWSKSAAKANEAVEDGLSSPDINLDDKPLGNSGDGRVENEQAEPVMLETVAAESTSKISAEHPSNDDVLVINNAALEKIRQLQRPGKADLLSKILNMYFDKSPEQLELLQQAIADGDFDQAKAIVHGMKSSSAYLGAECLASSCGELESSLRNNVTDNAASMADSIVEQYALVEAELQQHVKAA